jgi:excisionase family DNA binding protein
VPLDLRVRDAREAHRLIAGSSICLHESVTRPTGERHVTEDCLNKSNDPQFAATLTESEKASLIERQREHNAWPFVTIVEAAKLLGVDKRSVKRWQAAGKMPARSKWGHRWVYRKSDIMAMIAVKARNVQP